MPRLRHDLHEPHEGHLPDIHQDLHPFRAHPVTTHAEDLDTGCELAQCAHHSGAMQIT